MAQKNNLTIQVVSIIGGILTAIFFLGFLSLASIIRSEESSFIIGCLLIVTTLTISRLVVKPFLDAMNITFYVAGCILFSFGISANVNILFCSLLVISILTFFLSKGFILPFLAVTLFNISLFGEIAHLFSSWYPLQNAIVPLIAAFLFTNLFETKLLTRLQGNTSKYKPFHTGLFISCLIALSGASIDFLTTGMNEWIISISLWIGLLIMIQRIMQVMEVANLRMQIGIYGLSFLICLPTVFAPYLSGSLLLILICFHYGYKAECGASLLLFIYAISKYYYDLNVTLLVKSITLFFIGTAFIVAWYYFTQKRTKHEKI
ncbi:DUF4401 domain-containing protein [uncultured Bacteroides sp.]|uniref:DUF4401 domain-containing protein n=1 Tax=uncultured Bacteroides sp. TaxID=162156 RepID=UPI0025F65E6B|nr:DUF4401 domain-containing protein [uncultured Bacteroides sp.]